VVPSAHVQELQLLHHLRPVGGVHFPWIEEGLFIFLLQIVFSRLRSSAIASAVVRMDRLTIEKTPTDDLALLVVASQTASKRNVNSASGSTRNLKSSASGNSIDDAAAVRYRWWRATFV